MVRVIWSGNDNNEDVKGKGVGDKDERAHKGVARRYSPLGVPSTYQGGPCLRKAPLAYTLRAPTNDPFVLLSIACPLSTNLRRSCSIALDDRRGKRGVQVWQRAASMSKRQGISATHSDFSALWACACWLRRAEQSRASPAKIGFASMYFLTPGQGRRRRETGSRS